MNAYSPELWIAVLIGTALLTAGFSMFARWCRNSPAVQQNKLDVLHVGMTTAEVTSLLGPPRQKRPGDKGEEFWIYGAQWKCHLLVLEFNGGGTMREFVHGVPHPRKSRRTIGD